MGTQSATMIARARSLEDENNASPRVGASRRRGVHDVVAVFLVDEDQVVQGHVERFGDPTAILGDVRRVIADVQRQVERLVGSLAHAAVTVRDEGVDAKCFEVRGAVHAKTAAVLHVEGQ